MAPKGSKPKTKSRSKHSQRALDAFEIAEREIARNQGVNSSDEEFDHNITPRIPRNNDSEGDSDDSDASIEDEELLSDEAFGPSDEEDVLERKFKNANKKSKKGKNAPSSSEEEEEEDEGYSSIDESQLVSLSSAWDIDDKDAMENGDIEEEGNQADNGPSIKLNDDDEDDESSSSGEDQTDGESEGEDDLDIDSDLGDSEDSEGELSFSDSDIDEEDFNPEKLSALRSMISDMNNTDAIIKPVSTIKKKKQRLENNNIPEGEFAVSVSSHNKLTLDDLTGAVSDPLAAKSLALLQKRSSGKSEDLSTKTLSVPLAKRLQDRLDRTAAFEISKEEVNKWSDTVKANREAEHLVFPINAPEPVTKPSSFTPLEPSTALEHRVNDILKESSLADEKTLSTFEELATHKMSMAEVKKRRNELRLMRDLMFREEQKAKRIKKIKSKSYRKVHKKERMKEVALMEASESDPEEHDIARARERMSLKHKNTGKWAKEMVDRGFTKDKETRSEMEEMLRRGEHLRKKILGSDDDGEGYNNSIDRMDDRAFMDQDSESEDEESKASKSSLGKGILGMKFMQDAEVRAKQQNKYDLDQARNADRGIFSDEEETLGANQTINAGRRKYQPGTAESNAALDEIIQKVHQEHDIDGEKSLGNRLSSKFSVKETQPEQLTKEDSTSASSATPIRNVKKGGLSGTRPNSGKGGNNNNNVEESEDDDVNPWLVDDDAKPSQKRSTIHTITKDSSTTEKHLNKLKKKNAVEEQELTIDMNETLQVNDRFGSDNEGEDNEAEMDGDGATMTYAKGKVAFKQRELVKRAFAGDDVVSEFRQEKKQRVKDEGDKVVDVTIPGWGAWGGDGVKSKKKFTKKIAGIKAEKRKDAKLKNVIINERVDKKNTKFNASAVPFPFENREQYERSLRMPIGQEWATRETHQKLTKPRVIIKQGAIIDPIKAPFK